MRSPTSTRGLPSIGEGQPPFYSFTPFDGLRRQPLQNFLSSLYNSELGRTEGEELLAFTIILTSKNHRKRSRFWCKLISFQCWMGGVFIGPKPVQIWSSKLSIPGIPGSGGCTSWLGRLHRLAELEDWASGRCHLCQGRLHLSARARRPS